MLLYWGWLALAALLAYGMCRRLHLWRTGPFTIGFLNIWTVLIPNFLIYPAYLLLNSDPRTTQSTFLPTLQLVVVMFGGLLLGMVVSSRAQLPRVLRRDRAITASPMVMAAILAAALVAEIGVVGIASGTYNPLKALSVARSSAYRSVYLTDNLSYPLLALYGVALAAFALLLVRLFQRGKRSDVFWGLAATAATATVMLSFGSRSTFFVPIVLFLALTHVMKFRIRWSWVLILVLVAIPIFVFIRLISTGNTLTSLSHHGLLTNKSFIGDQFIARLNGFGVLQDFLGWFAHQSYAAGNTIVQEFIRWVPRPLLPGKPPSTDIFLTRAVYGQGPTGGGIRLFGGAGEMYFNFGIVGVFLWFTLLGRLIYWLHYGTLNLVRARNLVGYALVFSNPAILRGLANMGVNTVGTQQFLIWLAGEFLLLGGLTLFGLVQGRDRGVAAAGFAAPGYGQRRPPVLSGGVSPGGSGPRRPISRPSE